jgi:hypothetical protein
VLGAVTLAVLGGTGGVVAAIVPLAGGKAASGALAICEAAIAPVRACPLAERTAAVKALTHSREEMSRRRQ